MKGEWLRPATVSTSIIFVHGILSSGDEAWTNRSEVTWPELLSQEPAFVDMGIYIYSYQTSFLSGSYSLEDIVDDLKERLRMEVLPRARRLIFVCHSMGGLIVRKYLVERQVDLIEGGIDIGLFLVASPSLGDKYANWLSLVTRNIGQMQVEALRFSDDNMWLNSLDKQFKNLKEDGKLRLRGKELIEDKLFAEDGTLASRLRAILSALFWRRPIVARHEGARYFGEPLKISGTDHRTIAKPESRGEIQHLSLCDFINGVIRVGGTSERCS
jgi:predicted alpha/beta hydrolase family esterase